MKVTELQEELKYLRKSLLYQRVFLIASVFISIILFLIVLAKSNYSTLTVEQIEVVANGKRVLLIGSSESGSGSLSTFTPEGDRLVDLSRTDNGGALTTYNLSGEESVECSSTANGGFIGTFDSEGKPLINLSKTGFGGDLRLFNRRGRVSVKASSIAQGGIISTRDEENDSLIYILPSKGPSTSKK